jgi:transcriptional regulator with XRE-family HTH domain
LRVLPSSTFPNIKTACAARGIRQRRLALKVRTSPATLSKIINGDADCSEELRLRIAKILNADPAWLFAQDVCIPEFVDGGSRG